MGFIWEKCTLGSDDWKSIEPDGFMVGHGELGVYAYYFPSHAFRVVWSNYNIDSIDTAKQLCEDYHEQNLVR